MITEVSKKEYCQFCGVDFSKRTYAEKIHHSNNCDEFNAGVKAYRFKQAETEKEKLDWLFEEIGMDDNMSYNATMEIFECLMNMFRRGIYDDDTETNKAYPEIADYMFSKINEIKKGHNKLIQKEIDEIKAERNKDIEDLKRRLIK